MALKQGMDEVLAQITDPAEREAQRRLYEKYPVLQEGYLAQNEFNRAMDETRKQKEAQESKHKEWEAWHASAEQQAQAVNKAAEEARAKVQELEAKVAAGGDVTPQEMENVFRARLEDAQKSGLVLTKAQFDAEIAKQVESAQAQVRAGNQYLMDVNRVARKFEREFPDKEFDDAAFNKFVAEGGFQTVPQAFDAYVQKDRTEREIAKRVAEGVKAETEKITAKFASEHPEGMPGSGAFPQNSPGAVQTYIAPKDDAAAKGDYKLGDMTAAKLAANELRAEGKVAPV